MKEADVTTAFVRYLVERGWDLSTDSADHVDVVAWRGTERLIAEVKGTTSSIGTDVDTLYGQVMRRMTDENANARFALVVPEAIVASVLRVPRSVRDRLEIEVWAVSDLGVVRPIEA